MTRFARRDALREMTSYHSPQVDVAVRLNTNESPFPPPAGWVERLSEVARSVRWNRYPDRGATELRGVIAARHGVTPSMVFAANGSNEVIQTILLSYGGAGRTVATFEPTYQMYAQIARVTGAEVVSGARDAAFGLGVEEIERVVSRHDPAVTFLCNPNNPTGIVEPRANLEALLARTSGVVVVDEAYAEFSDWSALDLVHDDLPLMVTRTFSKTLSLAALRVGYVVAPEWMIEDLSIAALPYHLDAFKQAATVAALDFTEEMEHRVALIRSERSRLTGRLVDMGATVWPSGANFVLFRPPSATGGATGVWQAMVDLGVLVRDCSSWPGLRGCLRVTVGTPVENDAFLTALGSALEGTVGS